MTRVLVADIILSTFPKLPNLRFSREFLKLFLEKSEKFPVYLLTYSLRDAGIVVGVPISTERPSLRDETILPTKLLRTSPQIRRLTGLAFSPVVC